jgi:hypothetical protein
MKVTYRRAEQVLRRAGRGVVRVGGRRRWGNGEGAIIMAHLLYHNNYCAIIVYT